MAAAGAIAHDIYTEYLGKEQSDAATLKMSKLTAVGVGILAILLGIVAKGQNVAFLVGLAFAVAASANLPALLCTIYWKGAKERGIVAGIWTGLISSTLLILISPTVMGASAIFPLENPGIVSIPLALATTILFSLGDKN